MFYTLQLGYAFYCLKLKGFDIDQFGLTTASKLVHELTKDNEQNEKVEGMPSETIFAQYWRIIKDEAFPDKSPGGEQTCIHNWQCLHSILYDLVTFPLGVVFKESPPVEKDNNQENVQARRIEVQKQ